MIAKKSKVLISIVFSYFLNICIIIKNKDIVVEFLFVGFYSQIIVALKFALHFKRTIVVNSSLHITMYQREVAIRGLLYLTIGFARYIACILLSTSNMLLRLNVFNQIIKNYN